MSTRFIAILVAGLFCCGLLGQQAHATYLTGTITTSGSGDLQYGSPVTTATTTFLDSAIGVQAVTGTPTSNYSSFGSGTLVDFNTLVFTVGSTTLDGPALGTALWTIAPNTAYKFYLTGLTLDTFSTSDTAPGDTFSLQGSGYVTGLGFANTNATFSIQGTFQTGDVALTETTTALGTGVPDGGATVIFLGIPLAGLEWLRRRLAARALF